MRYTRLQPRPWLHILLIAAMKGTGEWLAF
jgi:hypothetical protein